MKTELTDIEKIRLQQWWMEWLRKITLKTMENKGKQEEKARAKAEKMLSEYETRDEIYEAYGLGCITEYQKYRLLEMWDKVNESDGFYDAKIQFLQEAYEEAQRIMRDLGQEV